jgi:transposase
MILAVMRDLFGVSMGLGTVTRILRRASAAVEKPIEEAREYVRWYEGNKHVDETGWYQRGADGTNEDERQAWLWVAATEAVTLFKVVLSRSQKVAKQMLGEIPVGTVITDRYKGYQFIDVEQRQLCWAHLYRDFVRMSERSREAGQLGRRLKKLAEKLFRLLGQYQEGKLEQTELESETKAIRFRMRGLLERGAGVSTREHERSERTLTKNTCKEMLEVEAAMWLFLQKPEIGITNNEAERALRRAVLWRRVSFGSQSEAGAETVARLLSVVMTLRRRGESVHKYLIEACRTAQEGRAGPTLLPDPTPKTKIAVI